MCVTYFHVFVYAYLCFYVFESVSSGQMYTTIVLAPVHVPSLVFATS